MSPHGRPPAPAPGPGRRPHPRSAQLRLLLALLLLLLVRPLAAWEDPNIASGFEPKAPFLPDFGEEVNEYNGNLVIDLPVGPGLDVGGNLKLQAHAIYNLNFWERTKKLYLLPGGQESTWSYGLLRLNGGLGPGWTLHMGRLTPRYDESSEPPPANLLDDPPFLYEDPSGARHELGTPAVPVPAGWHYGSGFPSLFIARYSPAGAALPDGIDSWEVKQPDGTVITLGHWVGYSTFSDPLGHNLNGDPTFLRPRDPYMGWYATRITDAHGRCLTISYHTQPGAGHLIEQIRDEHGRCVRFNVSNRPVAGGHAFPTYYYTSVVAADYRNLSTRSWQFEYEEKSLTHPMNISVATVVAPGAAVTRLAPACGAACLAAPGNGDFTCAPGSCPLADTNPTSTTAFFPVLRRIGLPASGHDARFTSNGSGEIERYETVHGALVDYTMQNLLYLPARPTRADNVLPGRVRNSRSTRSVQVKTVTEPVAGAVHTWRYTYFNWDAHGEVPGATGGPVVVTIDDPGGNRVERRYLNAQGDDPCACVVQLGRPSGECQALDPTIRHPGEGRLCQTRYYRGTGSLLRTVKERHVEEFKSNPSAVHEFRRDRQQTIYHDDSSRQHTVSWSGWDGYGNFELEEHSGDVHDNDGRTREVDYEAVPSSWILRRIRELRLFPSGSPAAFGAWSSYVVDPSTGRLDLQIDHCSLPTPVAGAACRDVNTSYSYLQGDPSTATWSNGTSYYTLEYEHDYGVQSREAYATLPWASFERAIDRHTGWVESEEQANGVRTSYVSYDSLGRATEIRVGTDRPLRLAFSDRGRRITATYEGATPAETVVKTWQFDGMGRLYRKSDQDSLGAAVYQHLGHDGLGRPTYASEWTTSASRSGVAGTTTTYDPFGRPEQLVTPDGTETMSYLGTRATTRSQGGIGQAGATATWNFEHDFWGNLRRVTEPAIGPGGSRPVTTYAVDVLDQLTAVNQSGRMRSYVHDSLRQLRRSTDPERGTRTFREYDARRHLRALVDGLGTLTELGFDQAERPTTTATAGVIVSELRYDQGGGSASGRLTERRSFGDTALPVLFEQLRYHPTATMNGRLAGQTWCFGGDCASAPVRFTGDFTWNQQGRLEQIGYPRPVSAPERRRLEYDYAHGHLSAITQLVPQVQSLASDIRVNPAFGLAHLTYGNGVEGTFAPDVRNRPRDIDYPQVYSLRNLRYDGAGNLLGYRGWGAAADSRLDYDLASRLTAASLHDQSGGVHSAGYGYDVHGNLTTYLEDGVSRLPAGLSYPNNRMSYSGSAYDGNGNQLQDGSFRFVYDRLHRLTAVGLGLTPFDQYGYDAGAGRVLRQRPTSGQKRYFLRDPDGQVLAEFGDNTSCVPPDWVLDYVYLDRHVLSVISGLSSGACQAPWGTATSYQHWDHLGTPRAVTDSNGVAGRREDFWPYGMPLLASGAAPNANSHKFTGHERDWQFMADGQIDYMIARYYAPRYGRFLSPDPVPTTDPSRPGGWNAYSYCGNEPANHWDPDGRLRLRAEKGLKDLDRPGMDGYRYTAVFEFDDWVDQAENVASKVAGGIFKTIRDVARYLWRSGDSLTGDPFGKPKEKSEFERQLFTGLKDKGVKDSQHGKDLDPDRSHLKGGDLDVLHGVVKGVVAKMLADGKIDAKKAKRILDDYDIEKLRRAAQEHRKGKPGDKHAR